MSEFGTADEVYGKKPSRVLAYLAMIPAGLIATLVVSAALYALFPFMAVDGMSDGVGWRWSIVLLTWFWVSVSSAVVLGAVALYDWAMSVLGK